MSAAVLLLVVSAFATAQRSEPAAVFANSCNAAAQKPFAAGLQSLHNFEYEESAQWFAQAQAADGNCGIAGWGLAMTYWHELWGRPTEADIAKGRAAVQWAQAHEGAATAREKLYIAAMAAFWDKDAKPDDFWDAATAYSAQMKALHAALPEDTQGTLFYALSLVATESGTHAQRLAQAREAGDLIDPVLLAEPANPGAAHYAIHAYDMAEIAPYGLRAARTYAKIAPDSPHALHMPSHIFAQVGLWREMAASNEASYAAAKQATGNAMEKAHEELHALDYLQYAYLQLGDFAKARHATDLGLEVSAANPEVKSAYSRYGVPWRIPVETEAWSSVAGIAAPDAKDGAYWPAEYAWLRVMAAARLKDAAGARAWLSRYVAADKAARAKAQGDEAKMLDVLRPEVEGWAAFAAGDFSAAAQHMRAAVTAEQVPDAYADFRKPANEMLGDVLLAAGDRAGAAEAYRACLAEHKGRRLSMAAVKAATE